MYQLINDILIDFRTNFKRLKTWKWFVILVVGFMIRSETQGVTSIISSMKIKPELYHTMLHFFRSSAYKIKELYSKWIQIAMKKALVVRIGGRVATIGDHLKKSKEGRHMPGIQVLHQDSENSGKAEYIEGHNWGQVSAIITDGKNSRSLPLISELQESPPKQEGKSKKDYENSIVAQMIKLHQQAAKSIGEPVIAILDAYFSSEVSWVVADKIITKDGDRLVEIVTRAQSNRVAYTVAEPPTVRKPGQPRKYGEKIVLYSLFSDMSKFTEITMMLYGKQTKVRYLTLDLIWMPVKKLVRFVVVESGSGRCVLMSSSLTLTRQEIITAYALRFKIETSFGEQKNDMGCFAYHFWTFALPKRKKWKRCDNSVTADEVKKVGKAKQATEAFVCLCTIATGILTIIAFSHSCEIWKRYTGWVRTLRSCIPTVATVKSVISQDFHVVLPFLSRLPAFCFIHLLLRKVDFLYEDIA